MAATSWSKSFSSGAASSAMGMRWYLTLVRIHIRRSAPLLLYSSHVSRSPCHSPGSRLGNVRPAFHNPDTSAAPSHLIEVLDRLEVFDVLI